MRSFTSRFRCVGFALLVVLLSLPTAFVVVPSASASNPANPTCGNSPQVFNGGTGAFYSNQFASNYVTAPPFGAADVPEAHFRNVFLFRASHAGETWDEHIAAIQAQVPTMEQIDAMTRALVCSSYFDLLTQYNINPPTFEGDVATDQTCVANAINDAQSTAGVISYATMRSFAGCEQSPSSTNFPQINIFVAPDVPASAFGEDTLAMCSPQTETAAYHGWGIHVPNFTVIPTVVGKAKCNVAGNVLDSLSHEMVELVSDPGGFGWIHASDIGHVDLDKQLSDGELADICSSVGNFPTPPSSTNAGFLPFPNTSELTNLGLANLSMAPYWSDQDNACEPTAIMNDTLASASGTPLMRMTSGPHDIPLPINQINPPAGVLDSLELDVVTGTDNLNSSSAFSVIVQVNMDGNIQNFQQDKVNQGAEWGGGTLHAALLQFPHGIPVSAITKVTIHTELSGDNWDVGAVLVQAAVVPDNGCSNSATLVHRVTPAKPLLSDGHPGIVRMAGGAPQTFTVPSMAVPANKKGLRVTKLWLSVVTGDDDLRGGSAADDNANAVLTLSTGTVTFPNINRDMNWTNGSTSQVELVSLNSLPPQTRASDITSFALQTNLPGGGGGDNWDVRSIVLTATLGCAAGPHPTTANITLTDAIGSAILADGTTGLCRLTGQVHDCSVGIPPPKIISPADPVNSMTITITTGGDDLRGSGFPDENATVSIAGFKEPFRDVNLMQNWPNNAIRSVPLAPLPATPVLVNDLTSIKVSTGFGGGSGGDNWDIAAIKLDINVTTAGSNSALTMSATTVSGPTQNARSMLAATAPVGVASLADAPNVASPWTVFPSANPGAGDNVLNGVTCLSSTNCLAVGSTSPYGDAPQALIEQWDGATWTAVATPDTGEQYSVLNGVACSEPTDCVAVGFDGSGATEGALGIQQLLIERWNGTNWSVQQSGNPFGDSMSVLEGVSCTNNPQVLCSAVGYQASDGAARTLTETFADGVWSVTTSPNADDGNNVLFGVSCFSATKCAAVGYSDGSRLAQTLALDWDGTTWSIRTSTNPGTRGNVFDGMGNSTLYSVSCPTQTACVSVGATIDSHRIAKNLIETEEGSDQPWTPQPSPNSGVMGNLLRAVSCISATNCVAVGVQFDGNIDNTLNLNLDGTTWSETPTPSPGTTRNFLLGDTCVNPALCIAVGEDVDDATGMKETLAMNFVPTPPNEPSNAVAVPGDAQAEISFTPPTDNGGRTITSYTVTANDVTHPALGGETGGAQSSPITVMGLTNGDTYTFTATATNAIGTGPQSAPTAPVVIKPAAVTKFAALTLQNGWFDGPFGTGTAGVAIKSGVVYFKGAIATAGFDPVAFTLPAKFRPTTAVYVPVDMCNATNGRLFIDTSGVVTVEAENGAFSNAQCFTSLDGVEFVQAPTTPLTLQNGWGNTQYGTVAAGAVAKSSVVYLQGAIEGGSTPVAFTLPQAMWPKAPVAVPIDLCNATNGRLLVDTTGVATVDPEGGAFSNAQCFTSLDGVHYPLNTKTPLTLLNDWITALGAPNPAAGLHSGFVFLRGALTTAGSDPQPFRLPVQLRPAVPEFVKVALCNGANGRLDIDPSGYVNVQVEADAFSNAQCSTSLDGVSFNP
jgi:hypothetical protein